MHRLACVVASLLTVAVAGCASAPEEQRLPADEVDSANLQIDAQRMVKRRLLVADPIERQVEAHLQRDPRVESARFAIHFFNDLTWGTAESTMLSFSTVVTSRQPMTDEEASELLKAACRAAGASANLSYARIVRDGLTWATTGAFMHVTEPENPNLSSLRRE